MWPALLAARLQANRATAHIGVVSAGIAGNRLLGDTNNGIARFVHHALAVPGKGDSPPFEHPWQKLQQVRRLCRQTTMQSTSTEVWWLT